MSIDPLVSEGHPLRVAVIGSGPSGFYTVGALLKNYSSGVEVDLYDRLPTPFGLVRGGVAPDHQNIKAVIRVYQKIAAHPSFRFFGNVQIGRDLTVEDLARHYDQIVYATGNETDRKMGIPGEELAGVHSGTELVGWYNGHPDFRDREFDLQGARRVAVVGNGNVSMDVTRILAKSADELAGTDIAEHALEVLRSSRIEEILLLGRRGPAQAAFSLKEIKEVGRLESADLVVDPQDLELDEVSRAWMEGQPASVRDAVDYLREKSLEGEGHRARKIRCRFLTSPVEVLGEDGRTRAVRLERNVLYKDATGTPRPRGTGEVYTDEVQLIFKAVGYRGIPIPGVPFDDKRGIFPNDQGRLLEGPGGAPVAGQYVVGWAKRGPSGLIGTNRPDAEATVREMLRDLETGAVPRAQEADPQAVPRLLRGRGVDFVTFQDWVLLDQEEVERGKARGKIREKFTRVEDMMAVIQTKRAG